MRPTKSTSWFTNLAKKTARATGRPTAFMLPAGIVVVWVTGPIFHFSDTWQLVINTGTTIVTFLMVFLIQNTQNRDIGGAADQAGRADPRRSRGRTTPCSTWRSCEENDLDQVRKGYSDLAKKAREELRRGVADTGRGEVA